MGTLPKRPQTQSAFQLRGGRPAPIRQFDGKLFSKATMSFLCGDETLQKIYLFQLQFLYSPLGE